MTRASSYRNTGLAVIGLSLSALLPSAAVQAKTAEATTSLEEIVVTATLREVADCRPLGPPFSASSKRG